MDKVPAVCLTLFLVGVFSAFAEAAPVVSADDLMSQGLRLRRDGKDQEALPIFEEASRQQPSPRAFAQLGLCEQALGLWVGAERHIQMALGEGNDSWVRKHEITLRESLKIVQNHLGSVEVWGTPTGARVSLDGQVVTSLPLKEALHTSEGRHVLLIEAPGHLSDNRNIEVHAGTLTREHFALSPISVMTPQPAPSSESPRAEASVSAPTASEPSSPRSETPPSPATELPTWRRVVPWVLLGGALVAGSIGVWQQTVWYKGVDDFEAFANKSCGTTLPHKGTAGCEGLYDHYSSAQSRTYLGYGTAGLLGIGAATLFILNATSGNDARPAAAFGLDLGPGRNSLSLAYTATF